MAVKEKKKHKLTRKTADKHLLYQWAVQCADYEVSFMDKAFRHKHGRRPMTMREDFCGTALVACEWIKSLPGRTCIGLDLDAPTLAWAREHNLSKLGDDARRIQLLQQDVRSVTTPKVDVVNALNFSYMYFKPLKELIHYFEFVRQSLVPGGLFVMDNYGGWESQQVKDEPRKVKGPEGSFTYIWDQAEYNPIDNTTLCHIHFDFKHGRRWDRAFSYEWRLYTPAEIVDALMMAGFRDAEVHWDVAEDEDENEYEPRKVAENQPGWLAYIVGEA